jgi:hypothetical protein
LARSNGALHLRHQLHIPLHPRSPSDPVERGIDVLRPTKPLRVVAVRFLLRGEPPEVVIWLAVEVLLATITDAVEVRQREPQAH